jgi:hypothetical protein
MEPFEEGTKPAAAMPPLTTGRSKRNDAFSPCRKGIENTETEPLSNHQHGDATRGGSNGMRPQ